MAAEPDLKAVREALAMASFHSGRGQGFTTQAGILLSAYEGKIADDEIPLLPPGDPGWLRQAAATLTQAAEECRQLRERLFAAHLALIKLLPPD